MTEAALSFDHQNDATPEGIEQHGDAIGRANVLLEALGQGELAADSGASYDTDDDDDAPVAAPAPKAKPAPAPTEPTEQIEAASEPDARTKRIEDAKAKLRAQAEERRAQQAIEQERAALAKEREELAALQRQLEPYQRALKDPRAFLDLAADHIPPDDLVQALPEMTSDEARAKWRQKTTETSLKSEIVEAIKQAVTPLQAKLQELEAEKQRHYVEEVHRGFAEHVKTNAEAVPGFAALVQRNPAKARRMADEMAIELQHRGELPGPDDMAARYDAVARAIEEEFYAGAQREPASNSATNSVKRPAAGKANPLGNRATSERSSIKTSDEDEDPVEGNSLEARTRLAERSLRGVPLSKLGV